MVRAADTSVLIGTYNQPRELELGPPVAVRLCRQTRERRPGEVLVGDDGSGDETGEVIDRWAARARLSQSIASGSPTAATARRGS